MLDCIDPNKFLLIQDDFCRFYLIEDTSPNLTKYIKEKKHYIAQNIFDNETVQSLFKEPKDKLRHKNDTKSIRNFKHLTIMHLIMFCCQQFSSYSSKISKLKLQKNCEFYSKLIPEYKTKEGMNVELMVATKFDKINEKIANLYEKNISRNTSNKSLLNSFFNILDEGLNTDYYRDFLPLVKGVKQKLEESNNSQQGQEKEKLINLRKYLLPKLDIKSLNSSSFTLLNMYKEQYLNIEDKYMKHLSDIIRYENYHITKEMQTRVDNFNKVVLMKKNTIQQHIKIRVAIDEESFNQLLFSFINDIDILNRALNEIKREEEEELRKKKSEEENKDEIYENSEDDDSEKSGEKKRKNSSEKININKINYKSLLHIKKDENRTNDTQELLEVKKIKEKNALPNLESFINSVYIYIIPNMQKNMLSNYIARNDFVYKTIVSKISNNANKIIPEGKYNLDLFSLYLTEAKNTFDLNIFYAKLYDKTKTSSPNYYFYSFVEVEISPSRNTSIEILNQEKEKYYPQIEVEKVQKIILINIIPEYKDNLGYRYITQENTGSLEAFFVKADKVSGGEKLFDRILNLQSVSDSLKCIGIDIKGNIKRINIDMNLPQSKYDFEEKKYARITIGKAMYKDTTGKILPFKTKIRSFAEI